MENSATDYTIIVNTVIRDNRLSASDLGLLIYLLHLPETWKIQPVQLADRADCNRQTIYTQLNRLRTLSTSSTSRAERVDRSAGVSGKCLNHRIRKNRIR